MPPVPSNSLEKNSSNIRASTDSHRRDIQAGSIPAALVERRMLRAPAARTAQPDQTQDPAAAANLAPASETQTTGTTDQPYQNDANANNDYDDEDSS